MAQQRFRLQAPEPFIQRPATVSGLLAPNTFMTLLGAVLFIAVAVLPFITASPYVISIMTSALIYIVLAMGLNLSLIHI